MNDFLSAANNLSGLLTFLTFIAALIWFIFGFRSKIDNILTEIVNIKDDDLVYKKAHVQETAKIKTVTYDIKLELDKQNIHQEYMRKISEDSTSVIQRMNELLAQLSATLNDIKDKIQ